jgi:hypothetical protein
MENIDKENIDKDDYLDFIENNPDMPATQTNIIAYVLRKYPNRSYINVISPKWSLLNPNITLDIIYDNPDRPWNFTALSTALSTTQIITYDFIKAHIDKNWNFAMLSNMHCVTWDIVQEHPDKPWSYAALSRNPNITLDIVRTNPDKPWNYISLSRNPNITWDIVIANPDIPWDMENLSCNQMAEHPFFQNKAFYK